MSSADRVLTDACFLFDDRLAPAHAAASLLFERPVRRIVARDPAEVAGALDAVEEERSRGRFVCGLLTYEAGYGLAGVATSAAHGAGLPLVDWYAFDACRALDAAAVADWLSERSGAEETAVHGLEWTESRESYRAKIRTIRDHLERGDTYQVNFTFQCRFAFEGSALGLYRRLRDRQKVAFGAYVRLADREVLSLSPELFVRKDGDALTSCPMKGTASRASSIEDDEKAAARLASDEKTQSENVMIVDLMRNDLARVAQVGSVRVAGLFEVQTFETVHQMVSTIVARAPGATVGAVVRALFPCGSVTGAPKVRTMQIIERLENEPRGLYTGALGFVTPGGDFRFSVPIRTLVVERGHAQMGVGSGIVYDSDPDAEFDECLLKAKFVTRSNTFRIIETLLVDGDRRRAPRLGAHLDRMERSAGTFAFDFDRAAATRTVEGFASECSAGPHKLRLTLGVKGDLEVTSEALPRVPAFADRWLAVSEHRVDSRSVFQRHKTTVRRLYDDEYRVWRARGAYDVLFLNEHGDAVEASRHNLFVERDGALITPPIEAGALAGIERQSVLGDSRHRAREAALPLHHVRTASRLFLTNAVRGMVHVRLESGVATAMHTGVSFA